jgi:hypothetical protein
VKFKGHWNGELYRYKVTAYNVHDREIVAIYKKRGTLFLRPPLIPGMGIFVTGSPAPSRTPLRSQMMRRQCEAAQLSLPERLPGNLTRKVL